MLDADAVVLVTAHPGIDYEEVAGSAKLFIDVRSKTRGLRVEDLVRV